MNVLLNLWISSIAAASALFLLGKFGRITRDSKPVFPELGEPYIRATLLLWVFRQIGFLLIYSAIKSGRSDGVILSLLDISTSFAVWTSWTILRGKDYVNLLDIFRSIAATCILFVTWDLSMGPSLPLQWWILPSELFALFSFMLALPAFYRRYGIKSIGFLVVNVGYLFLQVPAYFAVFHTPRQSESPIFYALSIAKLLLCISFYHLILSSGAASLVSIPTKKLLAFMALVFAIASVVLPRLPNFFDNLNNSKAYGVLVVGVQVAAVVFTFLVTRNKDKDRNGDRGDRSQSVSAGK